MPGKALIYFLRVPTVGNGKTRLRNFLTIEEIQKMSEYLVRKNFNNLSQYDADLFLYIPSDNTAGALTDLLPVKEDHIFYQQETDLGNRMYQAIAEVYAQGYEKIVLAGSDLYNLSHEILESLFEELDTQDVVITPSIDGGYGLIGMKEPLREAFSIENYSHEKVTAETIQAVEASGYSASCIGEILDIDDREDVAKALSGDFEASFHSQGEYNANFLFDKGQKLLRVALGSQLHLDNQIAYEYHALKALQCSGAVVEVYELIEETDLIGKGYLVEEFVEGRSLDYQQDMDTAADLLAKIHSVDPAKDSHLIKAEYPFKVMFDEFTTMFQHYKDWAERDKQVEMTISSMLENLTQYDMTTPVEEPCIINTELNSGNFIINPQGRSYIIDWEKPLIGEKEQDLGHFLAPTTTLWKTDIMLDLDAVFEFVDAYDRLAVRPVDKRKLIQYLQFTCLRGITWCAMAYVQNIESTKIESDTQTFNVIQKFISPTFLKMIQNYIDRADDYLE